jgi:hypothetical protein
MMTFARRVLCAMLVLAPAHQVAAQDLGFLSAIFSRVHRMSLFVQSLDPYRATILDKNASRCLTLTLCGAGAEVLIHLETRTPKLDLELGFGAGYLRSLRATVGDSLEVRGALRTLPNVSTHLTYLTNEWFHPYLTGSFGLVDLWNGRVHLPNGKQAEVRANAFEYGLSIGFGFSPKVTNGRGLFEIGYRARHFASIGYLTSDPLAKTAPRALDMSGIQLNAGWQVDLRPLSRAPDYTGLWLLTRVEGATLPFVLSQDRNGSESTRNEVVNGVMDLSSSPSTTYQIRLTTRQVGIGPNGVPLMQRYPGDLTEEGTWTRSGTALTLTANGNRPSSRVVRADDELMVIHAETGRRLHFRKTRR